MPSADWLSYLGAITGVSGAVMGFVAFRRSGKFKAIDLRLGLRKAQSTLLADTEELAPLLDNAKKSHERVAAASGSNGSGGTKHWMTEWDLDMSSARALQAEAAAFQKDCSKLTHLALESEQVAVHNLQRKIDTLKNKYQRSLAQDDTRRDHLRQDQHIATRTSK